MAPTAAGGGLERWAPLFERAVTEPGGQELVAAVSSYLLHVTNLPAEKVVELFQKTVHDHDPEFIMSAASRLRAEGRKEGRVEGRVEVLRTLLEARFGRLPEDVGRRLAAASLEQLDRYARRVVTASSLDAVFVD